MSLLMSFKGPNYPSDEEIERVKKLAEYFLENHKCVDPKDVVDPRLVSQ